MAPGQGCSKAEERVTLDADLPLMEGRAGAGASSPSLEMEGAELRLPKVLELHLPCVIPSNSREVLWPEHLSLCKHILKS